MTSATYSQAGVLTLFDRGVAVAHLHLSGDYSGDVFYTIATGFNGGLGGAATQVGILSGGDTPPPPRRHHHPGSICLDRPARRKLGCCRQLGRPHREIRATQTSCAGQQRDGVSIGTAGGNATYVITGTGNSAELSIDGSVILAGQFSTDARKTTSNNGYTLQVSAGDTLAVAGNADINGAVDLNDSTLTLGSLTSSNFGTYANLSDGASLSVAGDVSGSSFYQIHGSTFTVDGTLVSPRARTLSISATGNGGTEFQLARAGVRRPATRLRPSSGQSYRR